jgi:hypothetical protein
MNTKQKAQDQDNQISQLQGVIIKLFGPILMTLLVMTFGCDRTSKDKNSSAPTLTEQVKTLNIEMSDLTNRIDNAEAQLLTLDSRVGDIEPNETLVSIDGNGYSIVKTTFGPFVIITERASQYLDGYKIKLGIGNLTSATFNGAKLVVSWGPHLKTKNLEQYLNIATMQSKEFSITNDILSGRYTNTQIALTPAKADEIRTILVSLKLNQISLVKSR